MISRPAATALLCCAFGPMLLAAEITGFRGDGSGIFADQHAPTHWNNKDGANILWSADMPTPSPATPAVAGGKVFVMAEADQLLCFDGSTGQELWRKRVGLASAIASQERAFRSAAETYEKVLKDHWIDGKPLPKKWSFRNGFRTNSYLAKPSKWIELTFTTCSPVATDELVIVKLGTGILAAYDHQGTKRWARDYTPVNMHGSVPTPLIIDDKLYFIDNIKNKGDKMQKQCMRCLQLSSGSELWQSELFPPSHDYCASPVALTAAGKVYVVHLGGVILDAQTGQVVNQDYGFGGDGSSPAVADDIIIFYGSAFGGKGRKGARVHATKISPGPAGLQATQLFERELCSGRSRSHPSPVAHAGKAYFLNEFRKKGLIVADLKTGSISDFRSFKDLGWKPPEAPKDVKSTFWYSSLTIIGKHLYVFSAENQAAIFSLDMKPKLLGEGKLPFDRLVASPIAADNKIYIRSFKKLWCIGKH